MPDIHDGDVGGARALQQAAKRSKKCRAALGLEPLNQLPLDVYDEKCNRHVTEFYAPSAITSTGVDRGTADEVCGILYATCASGNNARDRSFLTGLDDEQRSERQERQNPQNSDHGGHHDAEPDERDGERGSERQRGGDRVSANEFAGGR